jgi:hypothetical protein
MKKWNEFVQIVQTSVHPYFFFGKNLSKNKWTFPLTISFFEKFFLILRQMSISFSNPAYLVVLDFMI